MCIHHGRNPAEYNILISRLSISYLLAKRASLVSGDCDPAGQNYRFLPLTISLHGKLSLNVWVLVGLGSLQIILQAMKLNMALLEFDWHNMRLADKKNYLIIINYMKKEFRIKTVFGNDLSLLTMSAVSFFSVPFKF